MDKSKLMMMIIIALLVLLLGTVIAVTLYLLNIMGSEDPEEFHIQQHPVIVDQRNLMDIYPVTLGEGRISTNLATGPDGRSYFVSAEVIVGLDLSVEEAEFNEFLTEFNLRLGIARSLAIGIIGEHNNEEVRTPEGRDALAEVIKNRLQESFDSPLIVNVFFSNWAMNPASR